MRPIAIFSSDNSEMYKPFAEPVSRAWESLGFEPLCVEITDSECFVSPEEIPTGNQAQMVRALLPALYPDRLFIVSDVDMLPLNGKYFAEVANLVDTNDKIVNVSADAYTRMTRFPMCYFAGYGSAFARVTGIADRDGVARVMREWWSRGKGWDTDEICFTESVVEKTNNGEIKGAFYGRGWDMGYAIGRIDRGRWTYDRDALMKNAYIDSHMLRPFKENITHLRPLFESVGVSI